MHHLWKITVEYNSHATSPMFSAQQHTTVILYDKVNKILYQTSPFSPVTTLYLDGTAQNMDASFKLNEEIVHRETFTIKEGDKEIHDFGFTFEKVVTGSSSIIEQMAQQQRTVKLKYKKLMTNIHEALDGMRKI